MSLKIPRALLAQMEQHAGDSYPEECCGLLGGTDSVVHTTVQMKNTHQEPKRRRFLIGPHEFLHAEKELHAQGLDVLGFYHSHPDHPAQPSQYDVDYAWPWYTYLILSLTGRRVQSWTAWVLNDARSQFQEMEVELI